MKTRALLTVLALSAGVAVAGPWDGSFHPVATLSAPTTGTNNVAVIAGSYVKVQCDVAAYVGQGEGSSTACTSTTCDKVAAGDRWYAKLLPSEDRVAALGVAATASCIVYRAKGQ